MPRINEDLVGKKYGYLTVMKDVGMRSNNRYFLCRCICGKEKEIARQSLKAGITKSCGCMRGKMVSEKALQNKCSRTLEGDINEYMLVDRDRIEGIRIVQWKKKSLLCQAVEEYDKWREEYITGKINCNYTRMWGFSRIKCLDCQLVKLDPNFDCRNCKIKNIKLK